MAPSHRLLWRGALSHPFAPLEGIAFVAYLPSPPTPAKPTTPGTTIAPALGSSPAQHSVGGTPIQSKGALDSPVALALETLRGRPSLPVLGSWSGEVDVEQGIRMHINPSCQLTVAYFTRLFCPSPPHADPTSPFAASQSAQKRACLRISLGSSPSPSASEDELLLFPSPSTSDPGKLEILVGRARPNVVKPKRLPPRPDDPLPRRVQDLRSLSLEQRGVKRPLGLQRTESSGSLKEALENDVFSESQAAKRRRLSVPEEMAQVQKPERPPAMRRKSGKTSAEKGPEKENVVKDRGHMEMPPPMVPQKSTEPPTIEEENKTLIKKHIVTLLGNAGCSRSHTDFKDCFSTINRGVVFALRKHMRKRRLERDEVVRLIGTHVGMYFVADSPVKLSRSKPREPLEKVDDDNLWA